MESYTVLYDVAKIYQQRGTSEHTGEPLFVDEFPKLRNHYWGGEIWASGYFVRTIGPGLTKEQIKPYILEQSEES